jgi:hypothetical protein
VLALVAVVGGVAAVIDTMSQAYALHNTVFPNQGQCIQYANSFKSSDNDGDGDVDEDDRQLVRDVIRDECKHD